MKSTKKALYFGIIALFASVASTKAGYKRYFGHLAKANPAVETEETLQKQYNSLERQCEYLKKFLKDREETLNRDNNNYGDNFCPDQSPQRSRRTNKIQDVLENLQKNKKPVKEKLGNLTRLNKDKR